MISAQNCTTHISLYYSHFEIAEFSQWRHLFDSSWFVVHETEMIQNSGGNGAIYVFRNDAT